MHFRTFRIYGVPNPYIITFNGWEALARLDLLDSQDPGTLDLGWRYTRLISLEFGDVFDETDLLQLLWKKISSGRMEALRRIYLDLRIFDNAVNQLRQNPDSQTDGTAKNSWFFGNLKGYLRSQSTQNNISISIRASNSFLANSNFFTCRKITKLRLEISYDEDISGPVDTTLSRLAGVLRKTINLQKFYFTSFDDDDESYPPWPIEQRSSALEELQSAFDGLRYLQKLSLHGIFFHPAFFLIPPPQLTTLKRISGDLSGTDLGSGAPVDLLECMFNKNKDLNEDSRVEIIHSLLHHRTRLCYDMMNARIKKSSHDLIDEVVERWGDGLRGKDFEAWYMRECLKRTMKASEMGLEGMMTDLIS
ncbi:hypothetical protein TWF281_001744 [Arthrobotrys megalospora]